MGCGDLPHSARGSAAAWDASPGVGHGLTRPLTLPRCGKTLTHTKDGGRNPGLHAPRADPKRSPQRGAAVGPYGGGAMSRDPQPASPSHPHGPSSPSELSQTKGTPARCPPRGAERCPSSQGGGRTEPHSPSPPRALKASQPHCSEHSNAQPSPSPTLCVFPSDSGLPHPTAPPQPPQTPQTPRSPSQEPHSAPTAL